ncbi:MAG TPA: prolyl oligopeptidase family serine peptidase [Chitinophagaceae bacterium]|nr:prolyl oligopeptidase family serine peptidase [Chitinophagaceae bacterium]
MKKIFFALFLQSLAFIASAQDKSAYEKHWMTRGKDTLPYRVLLPKNYDASKEYPLILVLHGSGERGRDNEAQLVHGWRLFLQDSIRDRYPAIVVFPQCPADSYWAQVEFSYDTVTRKTTYDFPLESQPTVAMKMLLQLLDELEDKYKLDDDRYYVGGLSMGGMGTFELVRRKPRMFAAAFPICGGANPATSNKLDKTAWWIFHGLKDDVVPPHHSQEMADALKAAKAEVKLTLYPDANHNSWDPAFAEKDLLPWLFSKKN